MSRLNQRRPIKGAVRPNYGTIDKVCKRHLHTVADDKRSSVVVCSQDEVFRSHKSKHTKATQQPLVQQQQMRPPAPQMRPPSQPQPQQKKPDLDGIFVERDEIDAERRESYMLGLFRTCRAEILDGQDYKFSCSTEVLIIENLAVDERVKRIMQEPLRKEGKK